mmetsp:Transcript_8147/g.37063  ORF Transcript_8147/g.37063 Transcript_8147/m.37063 type:complete len:236 (+) Transcript_8147:468-1175(+)
MVSYLRGKLILIRQRDAEENLILELVIKILSQSTVFICRAAKRLIFCRRTIPGDTLLRNPSFASAFMSSSLSCGVRPTSVDAPLISTDIFCIFTRILPKRMISCARSLSLRPAPLTIRFLRDCAVAPATRISGNRRSLEVIENMRDLATFKDFSASCISRSLMLLIPGKSFIRPSMPPICPIISICLIKSLKSKVALMILSRICSASSSFTACCALSTRVTTSPMPRILLVIRSG